MAEPFEVRPLLAQPTPPPYEPLQVHPRVFTGPQCDRIVELGCSLPSDAAALEGEEGEATNDPSLRSSRTSWIPVRDDTEWIYRKLATVAERANRRYRFELTGFSEDLQFTTYDHPGAFYTWHQDGLDGTVGHRKLSLVVQLSDPGSYTGGDLELFATSPDPCADPQAEPPATDELAAARERGTVLVFPSFEFHRVRPLRSGVRHSLVCWVSGPPFR